MNKRNVGIREDITFGDKISAIEYITDCYFNEDDDGEIMYTPYFAEVAQVEAIVKYFLTGVQFGKKESVYDQVIADKELKSIIDKFYPSEDEEFNEKNADTQTLFVFVMDCVFDKVEFRKQIELAKIKNSQTEALTNKLIEVLTKEGKALDAEFNKNISEQRAAEENAKWMEYQNKVAKEFTPEEYADLTRDMASKNYDPTTIAERMADRYFDSAAGEKSKELMAANEANRKLTDQLETLQRDFAEQIDSKSAAGNVLAYPVKNKE